jgi:hypothetical protein
MIVAHYFGLPQSLQHIRRWCDDNSIALIEDCAHSLFGSVGGEAVGSWGHYATASVSKFLPVPELGLLASGSSLLGPDNLSPPRCRAQIKGAIDILESACAFGRPAVLSPALKALFALKNRGRALGGGARRPYDEGPSGGVTGTIDMLGACDMQRIEYAPLALSRWLYRGLPLARVIKRRQANFDQYAKGLQNLPGTRGIASVCGADAAPYVYPLWVDEGDRAYRHLRNLGLPVFRWDRVWPGTPAASHDEGPRWSRHVLQLLCHQDLNEADIAYVVATVREAVGASSMYALRET